MSSQLSHFLAHLATDPRTMSEFVMNPEETMRAAGLSESEISAMRSGEASALLTQTGLRRSDVLEVVKEAVQESLPAAIDEALQRYGYSDEVLGLIHLLAARSDDAKEEVLRKALTLYGVALDALEKGNRVAILGPSDVIVHEVVGFEPVGSAPRQVAG